MLENLALIVFKSDTRTIETAYTLATVQIGPAFIAVPKLVVTNVRLNYIHAPLSDLFLVYTETRDRSGATPTDRLLSFKVTKAVAF